MNKMTSYCRPGTWKQVAVLRGDPHLFFRLCTLLLKFLPKQEVAGFTSDKALFEAVRKHAAQGSRPPTALGSVPAWRKRAVLPFVQMLRSLKPPPRIRTYMDYGAGDLTFAAAMVEQLALPKGYATDVEQAFEVGWAEQRAGFSQIEFAFLQSGEAVPFKNERFDLVTAVMVLHHIKNPAAAIAAIKRVMAPRGYLLIKEHDCHDAGDRMLIDVEHSLYIAQADEAWMARIPQQEMWCRTRAEWDSLLARAGFRCIATAWAFAGKKESIAPTRGYLSLYRLQ